MKTEKCFAFQLLINYNNIRKDKKQNIGLDGADL